MTITWHTATDRPGWPQEIGRHGSIEMFLVCADLVDYSKYRLRGFLPGFKAELGEFDSVKEAHDRAHAVFDRWLVRAELAPVRKEDEQ